MPDTFVSDVGQHIDTAGRVTYDFDAHIHARGLDLDASDPGTPPSDRVVRWLRTADGALIAEIAAFQSPPALRARALSATDPESNVFIQAGTGSSAGVFAKAGGGLSWPIINGNADSAFVRHSLSTVGKLSIGGVYQADSGPLNPGAISTAVLSHNLGRTVYPLAAREDAFLAFATEINWRYVTMNANQIELAFENIGVVNGAQARFNFFLVTLT